MVLLMAQMTKALAQDILNGAGITRNEIEQLCRIYLQCGCDRHALTGMTSHHPQGSASGGKGDSGTREILS